MDDSLKGYRGSARAKLQEMDVRVWSDVEIKTRKGTFAGIILPRAETGDDQHIVLKQRTGYNLGLHVDSIVDIQEMGYKESRYAIPESEFPVDPEKPHVTLLGTGGTIASRLDYRTGAVIPAFTPGELYGAVPELADICNMKTRKLYGIFSENMGPEQWIATAKAIEVEIAAGADGVVIGHGTDTMHHTAAILSFMVQDPPIPIVIVGSQRSSDRPSSDAALNLRCATFTAAQGNIAEVMVCMFGPTSDQYNLLHRGTRVRKMHSSHRDTFRTIGDMPLGIATPEKVIALKKDAKPRRDDRNVAIDTAFEEKVAIVYYYPNMKPDIIEALVDNEYKGIVIAGTGLGHVNRPLFGVLKKAIDKGIAVYMTVQTLWGYVQMYVYDTGRDLLDLGVVPGENLLPEVAYMKLCWVLGHTTEPEEVKRMMLTPVADEITDGEPHNGYIILQGGLPEVEEYVKNNLR
ncbi:MAG: Glu-tRNA(Gln) amidotransferase subunit GatD [Candidatus Eisenbacteria sp.]|nr:Glu-tRNA(Gln) amidotransferase subunit GatD [Candidatus Eisenbacteria bacterium]